MSRSYEDHSSELRALFFESANDLLLALNEAGLTLEAHPEDEEIIRSIRRTIHTLKGDSAACGFQSMSELAHELEDALSPRACQMGLRRVAELVLFAADHFQAMLTAFQANVQPPSGEVLHCRIQDLVEVAPTTDTKTAPKVPAAFAWSEYEQLMISEAFHRGEMIYNVALRIDPNSPMRAASLQLIRNMLHGCGTVLALRPEGNSDADAVEVVEAAISVTGPVEWLEQRCHIPAIVSEARIERTIVSETLEHAMLGELMEEQETSIAENLEVDQNAKETIRAGGVSAAVAAVVESNLRVDVTRIDSMMNLVGELIIGKSMFHRALAEFDKHHVRGPVRTKLSEALAFQTRILDELHKCVLKIRMVPVEQLFRRFPRMVRDVAKQCGKDVALEVSGENTDLDKSILDSLAEPLMHLVRNSVDHGIEAAEERLAAGKPARGTVYLNAFHQGTQVVVEVRDDGRGINLHRIRARALEKGIITTDEMERLSDGDVLNLIFEPSFSTSDEITNVSGRGIGMDVVRTALDKMKGTVRVSTNVGSGTTIQLRVPLTLASVQTLLFRVNGRLFALPLSAVVEITRIDEREIHHVDQREVLHLRDQLLTLVRLQRFEKIHVVDAPASAKKNKSFVIVLGVAEKRFGLVVDSLVGEEELVIKALPEEIVSSDLVSGASILGDGTVVLIINVAAVATRLARTAPLEAIA